MTQGSPPEGAGLIVVGASVGGLAAAVLAADRGCRAVVIEPRKDLGGGAATEAECIAAAGSRYQRAAGVADEPPCLAADIVAQGRHHLDASLASAVAEQGAPLVEWLADRCGSKIELVTQYVAQGHSVPRLHMTGERGGASLVADLVRAATHHSRVTVRTGSTVERLVWDPTAGVTGVHLRPERRGGPQTLMGPVLLACGGFAASDTLCAEHCGEAGTLPYFGWPGAVGEALRLGAEVGAATARLGALATTPFLAAPSQFAVTAPLVELGAILVNQAGRRFVDESGERRPTAVTLLAQPGRIAYLLFDDRIAGAARAADPFFAHVVLPRFGRHGSSLADLAKQFEINLDGLALTVDTYNQNLELGGDPFGREASGSPIVPPFHAIRVTGARLRTLGGLAVDAGARVLHGSGGPILGLYATGGAAAGLAGEGTEGALTGTEALAALGLARLAVRHVLAELAAAKETEPS